MVPIASLLSYVARVVGAERQLAGPEQGAIARGTFAAQHE